MNDFGRAEIRRFNNTCNHFDRDDTLGRIITGLEFFLYLTERVLGILFKKQWTRIPAVPATDTSVPFNGDLHNCTPV
jgi:hypothetical protein